MLDGIPVVDLSVTGVLSLLILYIGVQLVRGNIIGQRTIAWLHEERDLWRKAYEEERSARRLDTESLKELLVYARNTDRILRALPDQDDEADE